MTTPAIPIWLAPSSAGQLSNTLGTNTGADKITLQTRYTNPLASGEGLGSFRAVATRQRLNAVVSENAWDTWWTSTGNINTFPTAAITAPTGSAIYAGRVYVYPAGISAASAVVNLYSAPINGPNVGTWRIEQSIPYPGSAPGTPIGVQSVVIINGNIYAVTTAPFAGSNQIWYAPISASTGVVGAWVLLAATGLSAVVASSSVLTGYADTTGAWLIHMSGAAATATYFVPLNADGSSNGNWTACTNQPAVGTDGRFAQALWTKPSGLNDGKAVLWVIGGSLTSGGAPILRISSAALTNGDCTGAFTGAGTGLPANRSNFGFYAAGPDSTNDYTLIVAGGNSTTSYLAGSALPAANQQTTCWYIKGLGIGGGAWTAATGNLTTAVDGNAVVAAGNLPGQTWTQFDVYTFGGNVAGTAGTNSKHSKWTGTYGAPTQPAFSAASTGNALVVGDLGTSGVLTLNADGSVDTTFLWGGLGTPSVTLLNGDTVTIAVYYCSNKGDPSVGGYGQVAIGQPPTVGSVSPADLATPSTGIPAISFTYVGGAGGAPQKSYRIVVSAGIVIFDTGTVYGTTNALTSAQVRALLTLFWLSSGTTYTLSITVTSQDTPMSGSSAQGGSSTSFTPSLAAAPATPTTISATTSQTTCGVTVQWTNPGGSTAVSNRVYYRLTGVGSYVLLKDNIAATIGSAQSVVIYEPLVFGQAYDFVVSACTAVRESAQSASATSAAISPAYQWPSGFVAMLSWTNGTGEYGLFLVAAPKITRHADTSPYLSFGDPSLRYRYGEFNYRTIELQISNTFAVAGSLDTLLNLVLQGGGTLVYRDIAGNIIYCGFQGDRPAIWDLYRDDTLTLTESVYTYTP